jgi:hypothetical protein
MKPTQTLSVGLSTLASLTSRPATKQINVRLPVEVVRLIKDTCAKTGLSEGRLVSICVLTYAQSLDDRTEAARDIVSALMAQELSRLGVEANSSSKRKRKPGAPK